MKIPSCFYGTRVEVRKECAKVARKILKGETLLEAVAGYEMIDTKDLPEAALVLRSPYNIMGSDRHFYLTLVAGRIDQKWESPHLCEDYESEKEKRESVFSQIIENDWSILGLSGNEGWWLRTSFARINDNRHRWQPYLKKLCQFWDILNSEGERYVVSWDIETFPEANRASRYVLSCMGVQDQEVSPADLKALCGKYGLLTMDVYNDPRIPEDSRLRD
jgi:hypothetical protein